MKIILWIVVMLATFSWFLGALEGSSAIHQGVTALYAVLAVGAFAAI